MPKPYDAEPLSSLLGAAELDPELADRIVDAARDLVRAETQKVAPIAQRIEELGDGKASSATQRISDLRSGNPRGRTWVLASTTPQRLAAILEHAGMDAAAFRALVERRGAGLHPAWPEVAPSDDSRIDSVPGLPGGLDELVRRLEAMSATEVLVVQGPSGIGATTLLRRLEARGAGRLVDSASITAGELPLLVDAPPGVAVAQLRDLARASGARVVVARSTNHASRGERPDVTLAPWSEREIVSLAQRLGTSPGGARLESITTAQWREIAALAEWTPLTLLYLMRALADAGPSAMERGRLADVLVESVARARCPETDPEIVVEAISAVAVRVFERSAHTRWPATLSGPDLRSLLERLGEGTRPAIGGRVVRAEALAALKEIQQELCRGGARNSSSTPMVKRLERALRPPPVDGLRDALKACELIEQAGDDVRLGRFGVLVTAASVPWEDLLARAGDPSLHRVMIAAVPRLNDAETVRALDALLRSGPARQLIDLRVALAIVARSPAPAATVDVREVVGSVVALLEDRSESPWLASGPDVIADVRRASQRYGDALAGPLPVSPAVARWIELAPRPPHASQWDRTLLLPWQEVDTILAPSSGIALPDDEAEALLRWAVERGNARAMEIGNGSAEDGWGCWLGRRLPGAYRLELLTRCPPADWTRHGRAILECARAIPGGLEHGGDATDALAAFFARADVPQTLNARAFGKAWIEAAARAGRRDVLGQVWSEALAALKSNLTNQQLAARAAAELEARGDCYDCLAIAEHLADFEDFSALRALAAVGRDDLELDPRMSPAQRLRGGLGRRAATLLVRHRDADGLRAILPRAGERTAIAGALDDASRSGIASAMWLARDLGWWTAISEVIAHADDRECADLVRRWAADEGSKEQWQAIQCLVARGDREAAPAITAWVKSAERVLVLHMVPGLLRHPVARVRTCALESTERAIEDAERSGPGAVWSDARAHSLATVMERIAIALAERGDRRATSLIARLVVLLAMRGGADPEAALALDLSARHAFAALRSIDEGRALEVLDRLDADPRGIELSPSLARVWAIEAPSSAPAAILARLGLTHASAEHVACRMTVDDLAREVSLLDDRAWIDGTTQAGDTPLERHPWVAIRALGTRDPVSFAREVRTRCDRLAVTRPADALLVAEWLLDVDGRTAATVIDGLLAGGSAGAPGPGARKHGGRR